MAQQGATDSSRAPGSAAAEIRTAFLVLDEDGRWALGLTGPASGNFVRDVDGRPAADALAPESDYSMRSVAGARPFLY